MTPLKPTGLEPEAKELLQTIARRWLKEANEFITKEPFELLLTSQKRVDADELIRISKGEIEP